LQWAAYRTVRAAKYASPCLAEAVNLVLLVYPAWELQYTLNCRETFDDVIKVLFNKAV
jgi:hypothetical protein